MGRRILPLLLALMAFTPLATLPGVAEAELRGIKEGQVLPPRALEGVDGSRLTLPGVPEGKGEGKPVTVVVFWSTWSPRSAPLLGLWQEMAAEYAARPLRVVTINADHQEMDGDRISAVKAYLEENRITLPAAIDQGLSLYNEIGVIALPTTLFFAADGSLSREAPGFPSSARLDLREELERQLGIAKPQAPEPGRERGKLAYQPQNNALLYFGMGNALRKAGMREKAHLRYAEALRRDGDYADPLAALEEDFFAKGRTSEAAKALHDFLAGEKLPALADRY